MSRFSRLRQFLKIVSHAHLDLSIILFNLITIHEFLYALLFFFRRQAKDARCDSWPFGTRYDYRSAFQLLVEAIFFFFFFLSPFFPTPERHESLNEDKRTANSNTRTREQEAEPKLVKRNALNLHVLLIITSSTTHAPFIPIKQLFFARKDHFFARPKYFRDSLIFIIILLRVIYCYLRYLITSKTILRYK